MNKFFQIVKEVIDEWNPVDLLSHTPEDEYEPEIRDIVSRLPTVNFVDELAAVIHEIFIKWFGENSIIAEEYSIKKCYPLALKIWKKVT